MQDPSSGASKSSHRQAVPGQTIDAGKGRIFPCESCGADLKFSIGQQTLECPFCGFVKQLEFAEDAQVVEQDLLGMLDKQREQKQARVTTAVEKAEGEAVHEVRCESCGAEVVFTGSLTSSECPYCASPIQRENVHDHRDRIPVDGVLPFQVERDEARRNLAAWVNSRWFAPNEFLRRGVRGQFNGIYLPYWTFDSQTFTRYRGQRGDHYYVEVGSGDNKRRERRTKWSSASGSFDRFFDDLLVIASQDLPRALVAGLEPWPLARCLPFNQELLAGYLARTYETTLKEGFDEAKQRIEEALARDVRTRIGGDEQRVDSIRTQFGALAYKHLLLPLWLLAYRYHEKPYQVIVNAATGEVQGERPYSWVKIAMAVIGAAAVAGAIFYFAQQ